MSVNSSIAVLPPVNCLTLRGTKVILTVFAFANIFLILPLSTLVLCLGGQRLRQQRRATPAGAASDSNIFTYQMAAMETIGVLGSLLFNVGAHTDLPEISTYGFYMFFCTWCVKIHFHTLTCVERYLAVVHPVIYLGQKNRGCHKIRRIAIGSLWLLSLVWAIALTQGHVSININVYFVFVALALVIICFCCISVLCALRRPRPGDVGRERRSTDQAKQKAFNTVVTIMGALWFCLGGTVVCVVLLESQTLSDTGKCDVRAYSIWFSVPSSLVLPLLYLHRAGKLPTCRH